MSSSSAIPGSKHPAPRQLGSCNALTLEEARERARDWLKLIARGIDPADHEREIQLAMARQRENSVAAVFEDFVKEKLSYERRGKEVERDMSKNLVTAWGKRPVADITNEDVLASYATSNNAARLHRLAICSAMPVVSSIGRSISAAMESRSIPVRA